MNKLLTVTKKEFRDVKPGEIFSMASPRPERDLPFLNVKLNCQAVTIEDGIPNVHPFNVVALEDGRVRTFDDYREVYVYDKNELFGESAEN